MQVDLQPLTAALLEALQAMPPGGSIALSDLLNAAAALPAHAATVAHVKPQARTALKRAAL